MRNSSRSFFLIAKLAYFDLATPINYCCQAIYWRSFHWLLRRSERSCLLPRSTPADTTSCLLLWSAYAFCWAGALPARPASSRRRWPDSPKNLDAIALRVSATCHTYRIKASARRLSIGLDTTWRSPAPCAVISTTLRFAPSPVTTAW